MCIRDSDSARYFDEVAQGRDGKMAANWVINELFGRLKKEGHDITESPVSYTHLRAHETVLDLVCRLLLEKKQQNKKKKTKNIKKTKKNQ